MAQISRPLALAVSAALLLGALTALAEGVATAPDSSTLRFLRDGRELRALTLGALLECCEPREVVIEDPYYGARKRFGAQLLTDGAFLAFADAEHPDGRFFPIDRRQVDPAPFYLVWQGAGHRDTNLWPWPYQLVEIEIVEFAVKFPHVPPTGAAEGSPARRGFAIFRASCLACHSINGEGGKVGPELNVPRSIVEYREPGQLKEFIREPRDFRYTSMPSHPELTDADLDALLAYFTHMSAHKYDPGAGPGH
jgi:mono/diheme cytochrome c family protein